jgi:EAL domain-containing protein (putative c-di-GMP-specific phosphodiesterase class I)
LDTFDVVGFEALARWPESNVETPRRVFARAEQLGRRNALDRECVNSAIGTGLAAGLGSGPLLFVNIEPDRADDELADDGVLSRGRNELRLVFELTERSLLTSPHALMRTVRRLRAHGFAVALDDVGANPHTLALLDVVSPDIVKLDLRLVQAQPRYEQARSISAVLAHHERTGAIILAEGIETDDHLEQARALGAVVGQGFLFGAADPLPALNPNTHWPFEFRRHSSEPVPANPFDIMAGHASIRSARKPILAELSHYMEAQAIQSTDPPIVLAAMQYAHHWTPRVRRRYQQIARTAPLVAIFARDIASDLGAGIRGIAIGDADDLAREWTLVVLGAHSATALIARERHDAESDEGVFDFAITFDRHAVTMVARSLLDRIAKPRPTAVDAAVDVDIPSLT